MWCCRRVFESELERTFRQMGQSWRIECGKAKNTLSMAIIRFVLTTEQKDSSQETVISLLGMLVYKRCV